MITEKTPSPEAISLTLWPFFKAASASLMMVRVFSELYGVVVRNMTISPLIAASIQPLVEWCGSQAHFYYHFTLKSENIQG